MRSNLLRGNNHPENKPANDPADAHAQPIKRKDNYFKAKKELPANTPDERAGHKHSNGNVIRRS